jgi:hypothetical protein
MAANAAIDTNAVAVLLSAIKLPTSSNTSAYALILNDNIVIINSFFKFFKSGLLKDENIGLPKGEKLGVLKGARGVLKGVRGVFRGVKDDRL